MLSERDYAPIVHTALLEDAPHGDITSQTIVPADAKVIATLGAREPGVFAGADVFAYTMSALDSTVHTDMRITDGDVFEAGSVLAHITGPARSVLQAERVALNLVQRMSGIATQTKQYVDAVAGTGVRIVDTRKTTPGLRVIERHAVRCGGGHNHRFSLSDAFMAKDNHLALAGDPTLALRLVREKLPHTTHIEVEVDRLDQIETVLASGVVDTIMLDNFTLEGLRTGVSLVNARALVEASGGVTLDTVRGIAETGVDVISVGALTHSVRALDLGLDVVVS